MLFVLDDFLKAEHSETIPDADLKKAGEILSRILEKNPGLLKHLEFRLAPRKFLIAEGAGAGWSSWMYSPGQMYLVEKPAERFAAFYQPIIDYLESGGQFIRKEDYYLIDDVDLPWESYEEPGSSVLEQFTKDIREYLGDPEYLPYLGGACNLQVRIANGPFKIWDSDSGSEILDALDLKEWF